jgi:hypothetical protein
MTLELQDLLRCLLSLELPEKQRPACPACYRCIFLSSGDEKQPSEIAGKPSPAAFLAGTFANSSAYNYGQEEKN